MYDAYFRFTWPPFENTLDQRFMFMSEGHREVIKTLHYFVRENKSFALVCGDVGTGKTMIVHHLLEKLSRSALPVLIPYPEVEFIEILRYVARVFKIETHGKDVLQLTDGVKDALAKLNAEGKQVVLIIDEAHLLPDSSLENIRLLSNIELAQTKLLQILLIGQNELGLNLQKEGMRQLLQRINVQKVLPPMNLSETIQYIDHRLKIAGSSFDACFEWDCKKLIYKMTSGVPRSINRLCDTALLICSTEKCKKVTKRVLKKAHHAFEKDSIVASEARPSYAIKFKPTLAAAAVVLLLVLGVLGYREELGRHLGGWFHGQDARQEVNTTARKYNLPVPEAKGRDNPPPEAEENFSPVGPPVPPDSSALNSKPKSSDAIPGEAPSVKKMDIDSGAIDSVSPPGGKASSSPTAQKGEQDLIAEKNLVSPQPPGKGLDRIGAEKSGSRDSAPGEPDKETLVEKPYKKEGSELVTAEKPKTEDAAVPWGPHASEGLSGGPEFIIVTVRKGEKLSQIAARWFPEDPEYGLKSILRANPQIRNKNLLLAGQALRIPKKRTGE